MPQQQQHNGYGNYDAAWESYNKQATFQGNDRMSNLGANLQNVRWENEHLDAIGNINASEVFTQQSLQRSPQEIHEWRQKMQITCTGRDVPNPVLTFEETNFPQEILESFRRQGFEAPTMIQAQGWSAALSGRDIVGIAKTGSGKTLAFGIPAILHIKAQSRMKYGDGPIALVLAPTRELAVQIEEELIKLRLRDMRTVCCYGGAPRYHQEKKLRSGTEICIATPGRLIDFLENRATSLRRVTYLVMDEADRMLDMGFEPQIRKIVGQIRPDRQTLLWSATWPREVEGLARDFLRDWVQIMVGSQELACNPDVTQHIHLVQDMYQKYEKIYQLVQDVQQYGNGKCLIFTATKRSADDVARDIYRRGYKAFSIHGDKTQRDRERVLNDFRTRRNIVLVATDVAARGLDIRDLNLVVNFDFPGTLEDYVHRIGRTGRAGDKGDAHTLFTLADAKHARGLIHLLRKAGQQIPQQLQDMSRNPPPPHRKGGKGRHYGGKGGGGFQGFGKGRPNNQMQNNNSNNNSQGGYSAFSSNNQSR